MNRNEAIAYLTQCADDNGVHYFGGYAYPADECRTCKGTNDAGHLGTPGSRYGRTSADVAPVAYQVARIDGNTDRYNLDYWMGLAVNDSEGPQQRVREYAAELAGADVDAMTQGYLECQLWAQSDMDNMMNDNDNPPMLNENYSIDDINPDYVESVRDELADLIIAHPLAVRMYLAQRKYDPSQGSVSSYFGHDYYLTREHHGAGFWDRGLGELGRYLTDIAHYAGAADDLYDNGKGELTR